MDRTWLARRGRAAAAARSTKAIHGVTEGADDRDAGRAEQLVDLLETDEYRSALRALQAFPAGVAYLLNQWYLIEDLLDKSPNLLASQRRRCLRLLGIKGEDVLRDNSLATSWVTAQISAMHGPTATDDEVASFLGGEPLADMHLEEFQIRVERMAASLCSPAKAHDQLKRFVAEVIHELEERWTYVNDVAERNLALDVTEASADATVEGQRIHNYTLGHERSYMAALGRIEKSQKPPRPGPKGGPKKSQAPAAEATADAQAAVATPAPTAEPVAIPPADAEKFTDEAIEGASSGPADAEAYGRSH